MLTQLSLSIPLKDRETGFSYLSRLAARHGLSAQTFALDFGLTFRAIIDGDRLALAELATLGGVEPDALQGWSPLHADGRVHFFRGEEFHAKAIKPTTIRGCPICLKADALASDRPAAEAMAVRGHWLPLPAMLCLEHHHPLVPLWTTADPYERYDVVGQFRGIADSIISGAMDSPLREPRPYDLWLEARLTGHRTGDWLDQFSLYPAAHFCQLLGRAIYTLKVPKTRALKPEQAWIPFDLGYRFASRGEASIRKVLTELQEEAESPSAGPKKIFGDLYDRLAFDLMSEDYRPFRDLLRDHIATTWPLGPGDELMGEPVRGRRLHSILTAEKVTGIDARRLRKLLAEGGWVAPAGEGKPNAWELVDAEALEPFLASLRQKVSALDLQAALGMSRSHFELLRKDGYLAPDLDGSDHKPLWDLGAARKFITDLLTGAEPIYLPMHDWCDIPKAAQRLRISPGMIVALILDRKLARVGRYVGKDGYTSILVNLADVERHLQRPEAKGLTIELFAKTIGLKPAAAGYLVKNGHVASTIGTNPKTKEIQRYLSSADIEAFSREFVPLRALAGLMGLSWQQLRQDLLAVHAAPFAPDGRDLGAIYEWSEIENKLWCRLERT
jgi:hypothetical protein